MRSPASAVARSPALGLLLGGRARVKGGGFRTELRDRTAGQTRHFVGVARAVTVLGPRSTEWLSVHVAATPRTHPTAG